MTWSAACVSMSAGAIVFSKCRAVVEYTPLIRTATSAVAVSVGRHPRGARDRSGHHEQLVRHVYQPEQTGLLFFQLRTMDDHAVEDLPRQLAAAPLDEAHVTRQAPELADELFAGLDDAVFARIEEELAANLKTKYGLFADTLLYDTTNFFTYIEPPLRAKLANTGHNKDAHHHLRQVGLAMCVDKEWGIPLYYRIYRGNAQDAKTFAGIVDELIGAVTAGLNNVDELVLVLDKGR